ncbi:MAG: hypothetical protein ABI867_05115 [Kofleriaceae bacterium]
MTLDTDIARLGIALDARLADTTAALERAGVAFTPEEIRDGDGSYWQIQIELADHHVTLEFHHAYDVLESILSRADRGVPAALDDVRDAIARWGQPAELRGIDGIHISYRAFVWVWELEDRELDLVVFDRRDECWRLHRNDRVASFRSPPRARITAARARELLALAQANTARAPRQSGPRGAAVDIWIRLARERHAILEQFLEAVAVTAPAAPILESTYAKLCAHTELLADLERRFSGQDDWRSAIAVVTTQGWDTYDVEQLGCIVETARLDDELTVHHVAGPFAYAMLRTSGFPMELHAILDEDPTDRLVTGESYDVEQQRYSLTASRIVVTDPLTDVSIAATGYGDVPDRVIRRLLAARVRG